MIEKMKDPFVLYLEKPDDTVLGSINDILDEGNSSLSIALNQHYELELTANNTANSLSWYDYIQEGMYVLIGGIGHFKLFHPSINTDGIHETKTVSAQSCDVELEDKTCSYSINMGEETSLEYLVTYDDSETEDLVNPYTGIPYDWIVLYNTFPEQLEAVKTKYNQGYYGTADSSGEITVTSSTLITELTDLFTLIPRLKNKLTEADGETTLTEYVVFSYDGDSTTVTSITLTSDFLSRVETLITFYEKYRDQLSLLSIILAETDGNWTIGEVYGVSDGDYTLANKKYQFEIDETAYAFLTQTFAQASRCLVTFDILNRKVNVTPAEQIGKDTGIVLSYDNLLNSLEITNDEDSLSTRFYVTGGDDLGIEQVNFGRSYIDALDYKLNVKGEDGTRYYVSDELAEKYEAYTSGLDTKREQYIQYSKNYANYLTEIDELKYRVPNDALKTDWGTYTEEELEEALTTYKNLYATLITLYREDYGDSHFNDDGTPDESHIKTTIYWWDYRAYVSIIDEIECAIATYPYYSDQDQWSEENLEEYKDLITSWETEWSLYGTIELQAKIDSYTANMELLEEQSVEIDSSTGEPIAWDDLTNDQKAEYNNLESNYQYDIYKEYYDLRAFAQEYLDELNAQLDTLESELETTQTARTELVDSTSWESNFTEDECKILNRLIRDSTYENENILVTSINTTDEKIDIMKELLDDAEDVAFSYSRPQLSFSASADNLLATEKFKPLWEDFAVGNYMLVQMGDNSYVKLRMTEYSFNPTLPASDNFSLGFSTYVRSRSQVTDIERLLGISSSVGGRGSGGGSGSSSDLDDTISNTLLTKLLSSETFGTRVKDVILNTIDVKSITARYATFDNLKDGKTVISGGNIETGSITADKIDVDDLVALEATIGGFAITDSSIYSGDKSSVGSTERGIYLGSDGQISFGDSNNYVKYYYDSDDSVWRIQIAAEEITIGASGTSVEEAINSATDTANSAEAKADEALSETVTGVAVEYAVSDSSTVAPEDGWSTSTQTVGEGQYLWQRTATTQNGVTTYSEATCITAASGAAGKDGVGVSSTEVTYQVGESGTEAPTGTWQESVPEVAEGQYLWTRTVTTYTDGSTSVSYSVAYQGLNGTDGADGADGVGISSYNPLYYASFDPTIPDAPTEHVTTNDTSVLGEWNLAMAICGAYVWKKYSIKNSYEITKTKIGTTEPDDCGSKSYGSYSISDDGYFTLSGSSYFSSYHLITGTTNGATKSVYYANWSTGVTTTTTYYLWTLADESSGTEVGDLVGYVTSDDSSAYPEDGTQDGYWYIKDEDPALNYFTCSEVLYDNGGYQWTTPVSAGALAAAEVSNSLRSIQTLYYASSDGTTYPEKPTAEVTTSSTDSYEVWNLTLPTYSSDYPYLYICRQSKTNSGACTWSEVEPSTYSDNIAALDGRVETNTANIAINASSIESVVERVTVTETGISDLNTTITQTAEDLSVEISDAAKTATDYLLYDDTGLNVGNRSSGSWVGTRAQITTSAYKILDSSENILASFGSTATIGNSRGFNTYIDSDSVEIRSGATVLASFEADTIYLGKNSTSSKIDLCNSSGYISTSDSNLVMSSTANLGLYSDSGVISLGNPEDSGGTIKFAASYLDGSNATLTVEYANVSGDLTADSIEVGSISGTSGTLYASEDPVVINSVYSAAGSPSGGTSGGVLIAKIEVTQTYANAPIHLYVQQRGNQQSTDLWIQFTNVNSTSPEVDSFIYRGAAITACIYGSGSTWAVYVQKTESYDNVAVTCMGRAYGVKITYPMSFISSLPTVSSGAVYAEGEDFTTEGNLYSKDTSSTSTKKVVVWNANNTVDIRTTSNAGVYHNDNAGSSTGTWLIYISTSGTITTNASSDKRMKTYLEDLSSEEATALLENVNPIVFTYKGDTVEINNGFFAQDVLSVLKEHEIGYRAYLRIKKNEDDEDIFDLDHDESSVTYGLDYSKFVPVLWKGWQIHKSEIDTLKEEVESLKAEISYLRAMGS